MDDLISWLVSNWLLIASVLGNLFLAAVTLLTTRAFQVADAKRQRAEDERDAEIARATSEQDQLRRVIDAELVSWGVSSIEELSSAHILLSRVDADTDERDTKRRRDRIQASISALVDRGRLYFPNHFSDLDWPTWRERASANRGFRDPILDALMIAHEEIRFVQFSDTKGTDTAARNIFGARKAFISRLQDWLLPRRPGSAVNPKGVPERSVDLKEVDWNSVVHLVDDFEDRYGTGKFWAERPRPRAALIAALDAHAEMSA